MAKMKAWLAVSGNEWAAFIAAETRGKAQSLITGYYDAETLYIDFRVLRMPVLDGLAQQQSEPTVLECHIDGNGAKFRALGVCSQECIEMGCGYDKS